MTMPTPYDEARHAIAHPDEHVSPTECRRLLAALVETIDSLRESHLMVKTVIRKNGEPMSLLQVWEACDCFERTADASVILRELVRSGELIQDYGGDKFLYRLPDMAANAAVRAFAEKAKNAI